MNLDTGGNNLNEGTYRPCAKGLNQLSILQNLCFIHNLVFRDGNNLSFRHHYFISIEKGTGVGALKEVVQDHCQWLDR